MAHQGTANYDNNGWRTTTPYHNTLALQNWSANGTPSLQRYETGILGQWSQWMEKDERGLILVWLDAAEPRPFRVDDSHNPTRALSAKACWLQPSGRELLEISLQWPRKFQRRLA